MENNYGPVRVYNIKTNEGLLKTTIVLENVDLSADVNSEITERLKTEENIKGVKTFDWEIVEPGDEEQKTLAAIRGVLAKYFEAHSDGTLSEDYLHHFSAQDAIDEIADIVGEY